MALVGDLIQTEYIESATEKKTVEIFYPENLTELDNNYEKRGTSEQIEVPLTKIKENIIENVYVTVHSMHSFKFVADGEHKTLYNITYRVYKSKQDRLKDINSFVYQNVVDSQEINYNLDKKEIQQAYEIVKTVQGFENLIND